MYKFMMFLGVYAILGVNLLAVYWFMKVVKPKLDTINKFTKVFKNE